MTGRTALLMVDALGFPDPPSHPRTRHVDEHRTVAAVLRARRPAVRRARIPAPRPGSGPDRGRVGD